MSSGRIALLLLLFILGMLTYMSAFIVDKTEIALRIQFGKVQKVYNKPGLYFMVPFVNKVRKIDNRRLTLDENKARFWTGDQKQVDIDYYAIWKISNPEQFYNKAHYSIRQGNNILSGIINAALTSEIKKYNITQVISSKRRAIMRELVTLANRKVNGNTSQTQYGIQVLDVRVKQIEFPRAVRQKVYESMIAERNKRSDQHISEGRAKAKKIKAISDKERTIILAEANKQSEQIRGDGDAKATNITARAYGKNKEFYAFYRTLLGYEKVFDKGNNVLVLDPNSEFFKYFGSSNGK